jgi:signal transduction histidine kinase
VAQANAAMSLQTAVGSNGNNTAEARVTSHVGVENFGAAFLRNPAPHSHAVQFYDDEACLVETVGDFLYEGLLAGERVVVVATEQHRRGFLRRIAARAKGGAMQNHLVFLDARETLAKFMVDGMPDRDLFEELIAGVMGADTDARPALRIRAYGEMVDVLWRDGQRGAALRLEELWNDAGKAHSFSLLCSYVMDNFSREGDAVHFADVCERHSHVLPTGEFARLEEGARSSEVARLQQRARLLESELEQRKILEKALRDALRERADAEEALAGALAREHEARTLAEANSAFKEVFLGILGHDLRNPLNTVLATARIMQMRDEVNPEARKRLERIVSSSTRMARMIDQILDVTRARLAGGIPLERKSDQALGALVTKIVDETRAVHPMRSICLNIEPDCVASFDGDRLEQVVSNLLGNAVTHGDPTQVVTVDVRRREGACGITVHNYGPAIEPWFIPLLFDPFKRDKPCFGSNGLGLGLYISERIVAAHGGKIEVSSSAEAGTRFDIRLPCEL